MDWQDLLAKLDDDLAYTLPCIANDQTIPDHRLRVQIASRLRNRKLRYYFPADGDTGKLIGGRTKPAWWGRTWKMMLKPCQKRPRARRTRSRPKRSKGRPMIYANCLLDLEDESLYAPSTIAASIENSFKRDRCRISLGRFSHNHGFPRKPPDGYIDIKGRPAIAAWFGWRWKVVLKNKVKP